MTPELMDMILPLTHKRVPATIRCFRSENRNRDQRYRSLDMYDRAFTTATPGIVVTRFARTDPDSPERVRLEPFPVLTHIHTGQKIGGPYASLRTALKVAGCLGGLGNWDVRDATWLRVSIEAAARQYGLQQWLKEVLAPDAKVLEDLAREDVNCEA